MPGLRISRIKKVRNRRRRRRRSKDSAVYGLGEIQDPQD
jgi:hypothetical protein